MGNFVLLHLWIVHYSAFYLFSYECFCGQTLPNPGSHPVKPESACNRKCEGDRSKNCGGRWAISVYSTGL